MRNEGLAVTDFKALHELKQQAQNDAKQALPAVAKQFEAIFLQSMLKVMRNSQSFIDESNPFKGKYAENFQEMLDAQFASSISSGRNLGLADMLARQLEATTGPAREVAVSAPISAARTLPSYVAPMPSELTDTLPVKAEDAKQGIDSFVKSVWPYARQAASLLGLDPKILMAQAALETGWGHFISKDASGVSSNNFFNIKAANEDESVEVKTTEFIANTPVKVTASFKKYSSAYTSFKDYVSLIKGSGRYEEALANAHDPQAYMMALHNAGYATDPQYANKVLSIYNGDELQQALMRNGFTAMK